MSIQMLVSAFIIIIALLMQIKLGAAGLGFEYAALIVLIGFAFVLRMRELCIFIALAVLILNWQPTIVSGELIALGVLPLAVNVSRRQFRGSLLFAYAMAMGGGVFAWLAAADIRFLTEFSAVLMRGVMGGFVLAALLFPVVRMIRASS